MNHDFVSVRPIDAAAAAALATFQATLQAECRKCGVTWGELLTNAGLGEIGWYPCTGDAYVCRVARKLMTLRPDITAMPTVVEQQGGRWFYHGPAAAVRPWAMTGGRFAFFLWLCTVAESQFGNDTLAVLRRAVAEDPGVLPVYADALEEAGCTDVALLDALRTPGPVTSS